MKKENYTFNYVGVKSEEDLLNKTVSINNMRDFKIVGFIDKESPSIYANRSVFVNILNNTEKADNGFGFVMAAGEESIEQESVVHDYNLYLDDLTLKKGKWPTEDYEVIVNISNEYNMKLNKTIKEKVNDHELTVVGYYESKTNKQAYYVSNNTVKYNVINNNDGFMIYPKNKSEALRIFKDEYKLNIVDRFEKDKENYLKEQKESIISSLIFAGIILGISLIEIYLMIRSSFLSRIKEVGILRAIGVKKTDIYRMFLGEILAITTCASMPGIALMAYILKAISQIPYADRMFIINIITVGLSVIIVYLFNIIVGLMPLNKVLRKRPARILARHDLE